MSKMSNEEKSVLYYSINCIENDAGQRAYFRKQYGSFLKTKDSIIFNPLYIPPIDYLNLTEDKQRAISKTLVFYAKMFPFMNYEKKKEYTTIQDTIISNAKNDFDKETVDKFMTKIFNDKEELFTTFNKYRRFLEVGNNMFKPEELYEVFKNKNQENVVEEYYKP